MSTFVTLKFELPKETIGELEQLMSRAGLEDKKDLLNNALTLLEWAITEREGGRTIASLDIKKKHAKLLVMPILSAIQERG